MKAARRKELDDFETKNVWKEVSLEEAHRISDRAPITVRWVDVNKGDDDCPDIRSRLVARQIRGANEDPMFAPTPPLEALRRIQVSSIDISRAYFNAKCDPTKPTFVALPTEDKDHRSICGLLLKHMYGTQAAADCWQQEYSSTMTELGFKQGVACPWVFWHESRSLRVLA